MKMMLPILAAMCAAALSGCSIISPSPTGPGGSITLDPIYYGSFLDDTGNVWAGGGQVREYHAPSQPVAPLDLQK